MKKLEYKRFKCQTELTKGKNEDEYFLATISTNQVDRDGDIIDEVKYDDYNNVVLYRHNLTPGATAEETLPVGHCLWIKKQGDKTLAAVKFNRETKLSELLYRFYKNKWMSDWSIGFRPEGEIKPNTDKEGNIIGRHIPVANMHEFSSVPIGANQYTETEYVQMKELGAEVGVDEDFIKKNLIEIVENTEEDNEDIKPYENEHSCRLESPDKYKKFARNNCSQKSDGKCIDVIYGILASNKSEIQALHYPIKSWTEEAAKAHCKSRKGTFEAAKKEEKDWNTFKGMFTELTNEIVILSGKIARIEEKLDKMDDSIDLSYDEYLELSDSGEWALMEDSTIQELEIIEENDEDIELIDGEET